MGNARFPRLHRPPIWAWSIISTGLVLSAGFVAVAVPFARERWAVSRLESLPGPVVIDTKSPREPTEGMRRWMHSTVQWLDRRLGKGILLAPRFMIEIRERFPADQLGLVAMLRNVETLDVSTPQFCDEHLGVLNRLPQLRFLSLRNSTISSGGLKRLRHLPLTSLDLTGPAIRDDHVSVALEKFRSLESVDLSDTSIDDHAVELFRGHPNITNLVLDRTCITDRALVCLPTLPKLECFSACETIVTDEGMDCLMRCGSLQDLALGGTLVTDFSLAQVPPSRHFERIFLSNTQVSDSGLLAFRGTVRFLSVDHTMV